MDKITHFEIPVDTENPEKTIDFYKKVFSWTADKWKGPGEYWMARTVETDEQFMPKEVGAINGGFTTKEELKSPTIVITVDNIKEKMGEIKENGGELAEEIRQVGDMGLYARFKNPDGNLIGIWETLKKE